MENDVWSIFAIIILVIFLISAMISIITIVGEWKTFTKAGKPGWAAIIPIYNYYIMLEIAELPAWYLALFFIPFVNIYITVVTYIEFAKRFNESVGFAVGMLFFPYIFFPILGFSDRKYSKIPGKVCPKCKTRLESDANFCIKCGHKFN